jgi:murein DD-endopeptidase MepM/ murein hydrolase activator NlpD
VWAPLALLAAVAASTALAPSASARPDPLGLVVPTTPPVRGEPVAERPDAGIPAVTPSKLVLGWPARGTVTDGFGPRWGRMHLGLDIGILAAPDVTAAVGGVVKETGWLAGFEGYGNVVLVDVGGGFRTMYAHLSRIDVAPGTWVDAGERVGIAGCTGSCTGTHLHFELHRGASPIDPMPFLAR